MILLTWITPNKRFIHLEPRSVAIYYKMDGSEAHCKEKTYHTTHEADVEHNEDDWNQKTYTSELIEGILHGYLLLTWSNIYVFIFKMKELTKL